MTCVLAADIGGTSCRLAICRGNIHTFETIAEASYPSQQYQSLNEILQDFLDRQHHSVEHACFGVAGTVRGDTVQTQNLPWIVQGNQLAVTARLPFVHLINDLVANVYGIAALGTGDLLTLNQGEADPSGTIAVISAGTGLGEAVAYWNGTMHTPLPSESGHADFAPRTDLEMELLRALRTKYDHVSSERIISGPGLYAIYRFLLDRNPTGTTREITSILESIDPSAAIAQKALEKCCPLCSEALDVFVSCYGAEAGNLALRSLAYGGIYLGGGIAPKISTKLTEPAFMQAFTAKGRLKPLLENIPVRVILNDRAALMGAARYAFLHTPRPT